VELRWLGASGLRVSTFALGTMGFGAPGSTEEDARAQVDLALERGVLLFDTADRYGDGASEEVLGRALGARRDDVLLSTKVHARTGPGPNDVGQSRWHVLRGCEASLRRLGTDRIDVYHVHGFDGCTPVAETVAALDQLVRDGKVRYVACSNQAAWQVVQALGVAELTGHARYVATQS
jgi:aryl-alcohol dehydrogenase-like predicted oxidoreductase